ncbi:MAG: LysE family transporter [Pseudomonadota bacterium]
MTLAAFIGIALIHLAAAASPGPAFVVAVRTAAAEGLRPAIGLALGLGIAAATWALAALLGLAVLFEVAPALLTVLKVVGGAFLIWIAWKTWQHAGDPLPTPGSDIATPRSFLSAVRLGMATQFANPKPAVFFGAVFVGLVPPGTAPVLLTALIAVVFLQETLWYVMVARVFSLSGPRTAYARFKAAVDRSFGGLIALFGIKIAAP